MIRVKIERMWVNKVKKITTKKGTAQIANAWVYVFDNMGNKIQDGNFYKKQWIKVISWAVNDFVDGALLNVVADFSYVMWKDPKSGKIMQNPQLSIRSFEKNEPVAPKADSKTLEQLGFIQKDNETKDEWDKILAEVGKDNDK